MSSADASAGPAVLHYVQRWLDVSAGFVHGQVSRSRRRAVVVASEGVDNLDRFPHRPVVSLGRLRSAAPDRVRQQVLTAALLLTARRHRVGLVHVHFGYRAYETAGAVGRLDVPWVVSLHGHDATGAVRDRPHLYDGVLDRADAVVVPSAFFVDAALAAGARAETLRVIPAGVDTTWFTPAPLPADPQVVFVGRFVEKKGLDVLAAAWPRVVAAVPGARLRVLGVGPLEGVARAAGAEVVLRPDRTGVRDALRAARVLVSPSRTAADGDSETLLIANLEAQATGRPVVTTRHGGIPEYVRDGETAVLVPEGDSAALGDALVAVLTDEELATRLGGAGPAWAARFDVAAMAATVDDLYDELLSGRSQGRSSARTT